MISNSFGKYSYKKEYVYNGIYRYKITKGSKTITTPLIQDDYSSNDSATRRIAEHAKNFKYYVDNGRNAAGGWMDGC
ncbi:hypothetical protein [Marinisporobacter balticus]|uniref:Uncharacterized protein n=1 Tax=Marinisporobacter balticus TaxID=2018667 RepID=A0A4R2K7E4_9FIRM|nr:hypothetical protein [Marinisporobacter balticus]TCO69263.1 hypothetical protein EV214_13340 [Marinisporobacter balticus]